MFEVKVGDKLARFHREHQITGVKVISVSEETFNTEAVAGFRQVFRKSDMREDNRGSYYTVKQGEAPKVLEGTVAIDVLADRAEMKGRMDW